MNFKKSMLLSVSALGFIMSAPAMAQSILNPQSATGDLFQNSGANISASSTGLTALALGNQFSANSVNQIGNGTSAPSVSDSFSFGQVIGGDSP